MAASKKNEDVGQADVQAKADEETAQGFSGVTVDPTPSENYTVSGVTSGAPTPETDEDARLAAARELSKHARS